MNRKIVRMLRKRKSFAMKHIPNCKYYVRVTKCQSFFEDVPFYRKLHTAITVRTVMVRLLLKGTYSKQHSVVSLRNPNTKVGWIRCAIRSWFSFLILVPLPFFGWSNWTLTSQIKCHSSENKWDFFFLFGRNPKFVKNIYTMKTSNCSSHSLNKILNFVQ